MGGQVSWAVQHPSPFHLQRRLEPLPAGEEVKPLPAQSGALAGGHGGPHGGGAGRRRVLPAGLSHVRLFPCRGDHVNSIS